MAITNQGANTGRIPEWARVENLRISFYYEGPSEVAKQLMGYAWDRAGYSLEWLHRRVTNYDRNIAAEMQAYGANAGCLVWSTGFSMENDRFHWEIVKRRIPEFHARGMHIIVYISLTNCFWKEMFQADPESESWRQIGPDGEPVPYQGIGYGGREVTRYLMCPNNPHWRAYQKKRIAEALAAGVDGFFWDNNFVKCHCRYCQERFHAFTRERLGEECEIPRPLEEEPPSEEDLRRAREVVFDWIPLSHPLARVHLAKNLFRYLSILDMLEELKAFAAEIKPDLVWSNNGHLCHSIYDSANLMLSEDLVEPRWDGDSDLIRTNTGVLRYLYEEVGRETPAIVNGGHLEVLANGCASYSLRDPEANAFVADHPELYANAQSVARVGLVAAEMNYINQRSHWFDNLVRRHLLYDVIPRHRLDRFDLALYDVLLLRSILFLSDEDCERLRRFVANGGTLICTNATSLYDENWRKRDDFGLSDVFGAHAGDSDRPERIEHPFGQGFSIWYPGAVEIEIENDPNGAAADGVARDVVGHLSNRIVELTAPSGVAVNVMLADAGLVAHVLNYRDKPVDDVNIRLLPGDHLKGTALRVLPLGGGSAAPADVSAAGGLSFRLPKLDRYTAVVVTPE